VLIFLVNWMLTAIQQRHARGDLSMEV